MITTKVGERTAGTGLLGRASEQAQLLRLLEEDGPAVLFLHGLGGIGKTSLLSLVSAEARRQGAVVVRLDGNLLEPSPAGFMSALIWLFATRSSVLAAASWIPAPPPG